MKRRIVVFGFIGILSILLLLLFSHLSYRNHRMSLAPITAWLPSWEYVVDIGNIWHGLWPGYFQNGDSADYIVLQNNRAFPVAIGGWDVRSSNSAFRQPGFCQYVIPSDRTIAPFSDVHIWAKAGHDHGIDLYAGCSFDSWPAVFVCPGGEYPHIITTLGRDMRVEVEQPPRWFSRPIFWDPPCGL